MNGSLFIDLLMMLFLRNFVRLGGYDIQTTHHIKITTKEQFQKKLEFQYGNIYTIVI
jgi:hypothetical protein